jgi:hypothetical protein
MFKLVASMTLAASLAAFAQMKTKSAAHQSTDEAKIADALRAAPSFITRDVVIADWPANPKDPNAEYRVLRPGKSDWTCLPGSRTCTEHPPVRITRITWDLMR